MKTMTRTLVALLAAVLALCGVAAFAGDSTMTSPLPTLNVWGGGKTSLSVFGGMGKTSVLYSPRVEWGETKAVYDYDDDDISFGLRYAFPVSENLTLEANASYFKRETELADSPMLFAYTGLWDGEYHEVVVNSESQEEKRLNFSLSGLYALPSGADSPIRGGLFFGIHGRKTNLSANLDATLDGIPLEIVDEASYIRPSDDDDPGKADELLPEALEHVDGKTYGVQLGITADIHVVRDVLRVTPIVGYRYDFIMPDTGDSVRLGGAMYGLELGYRPGGAEGKFEVVVTPYFMTERRKIGGAPVVRKQGEVETIPLDDLPIEKQYEHRNGWSVLLRYYF